MPIKNTIIQMSRAQYIEHLIKIGAYEGQSLKKIPKKVKEKQIKNLENQEKQEVLEKWMRQHLVEL